MAADPELVKATNQIAWTTLKDLLPVFIGIFVFLLFVLLVKILWKKTGRSFRKMTLGT